MLTGMVAYEDFMKFVLVPKSSDKSHTWLRV